MNFPRASAVASNPGALSNQLERREDGIWYSHNHEALSYPEDGNQMCFELEEESFWFRHRSACVRALIQRFPPPGTIYDIGGGNGIITRTLLDAGFETVLVEPGESGARNARRRAVPTVICASFASANFREASLPAAGMFDVLEHIEDDQAFLEDVHRSLAPDGRLYLSVPAFSWLWSDDDVRAGHFRRYSLDTLLKRIRTAGFAPLYSTYFFSLLPLPLFVLRSIPSLFGRRALTAQCYGRLHKARARSLTDSVWNRELRRIEASRVIPFGSSCLVAAKKISTV